ncbi:MAG: hypothetical protein KAX38_08695, partial [Candidatus Krumholzibacteria bacterium]|nr:hypothetical protein [Candidatus Krumholzibacteria bacterium]
MIKIFTFIFVVYIFLPTTDPASRRSADSDKLQNNDFYDDSKTYILRGPEIEIAGEVINPGKAKTSDLELRSVIRRDAVMSRDAETFVGAYRYDGYSLFDILRKTSVSKKNYKEFHGLIDLLIIVENDEGESVVISWGEVFYPNVLHRIIIATR